MKKYIKSIVLIAAFLIFGISNANAQDYSKARKHPSKTEVVLSTNLRTKNGYDTYQAAYKAALREAQRAYPEKDVEIRDLREDEVKVNAGGSISHYYRYTIVEMPSVVTQKLYVAIEKATKDIEEGNRFALDKVTVTDRSIDKEKIKGQVVDMLLERNYKVVAKDMLERFSKEQNTQQNGSSDEENANEQNKFTAVGYYVIVRVTEEYVQVQVVNVSTGEFEGNVTENL
jgi:hypothetical protein